jgi:uncharacterized protein (DUF433 family)
LVATGSYFVNSVPPLFPAGTRLAVDFVIGLMADGWSESDILRNYSGLSHEDLAACFAYVRDVLRSEKVYPSAA